MFRYANRYALHRRLVVVFFISICISLLLTTQTSQQNPSLSKSIIDQTIILIRTSHNCQSRLNYLQQSWIPTDYSQQSNIYFLTDSLLNYTNQTLVKSFRNFIETNCPQTHNQLDLCCKTASEFEFFYNLSSINPNLQWMCRFDDDQYVNLNNLYKFLSKFDPSKPYYIGRTSTDKPSKIPRRIETYRFATYGAGVCFSRALLQKLQPHVNKTIFPYRCQKLGIADDGCIGYFTEFILNISLISVRKLFHSHLENLNYSFRYFNLKYLQNAITLGFAWDRYDLFWLPIIHQLIELTNQGQEKLAEKFWLFLQNYEKTHPENLKNKYDRSCKLYRK